MQPHDHWSSFCGISCRENLEIFHTIIYINRSTIAKNLPPKIRFQLENYNFWCEYMLPEVNPRTIAKRCAMFISWLCSFFLATGDVDVHFRSVGLNLFPIWCSVLNLSWIICRWYLLLYVIIAERALSEATWVVKCTWCTRKAFYITADYQCMYKFKWRELETSSKVLAQR